MTQSEACALGNCDVCRRATCDCHCHDDEQETTYGGYATQDEYYAEWGES